MSSGELQGAEEKRIERHSAVKFLEGSVLNRGTVAIERRSIEPNRGEAPRTEKQCGEKQR